MEQNDYPPSMKNLEPRVRNKAVEIANALLEEDYDEDVPSPSPPPRHRSGTRTTPRTRSKRIKHMKEAHLHAGELLLLGPHYERPLTVCCAVFGVTGVLGARTAFRTGFFSAFSVPYVTVMVITCPAIDTANIVYKVSTNGI